MKIVLISASGYVGSALRLDDAQSRCDARGYRAHRKFYAGSHVLVDAQGKSRISLQDYAIAMIDELERPAHSRRRFTVGY